MKDLTAGKESRLILNFALPMLLGNVFQQLYNVVDSVIVGNFIGKEALAAVGASFPIVFTLISLIIGVASGGTIVIAQYFGARDLERVKKTIDTLFIFLFFASLAVTITGILLSERIFIWLGLPQDVMPQAKIYLDIFLLGMVVFFGFNGTSAVLRGLGDSKTPLYFLILSTLMNIGLDLLFVVVFHWGLAGVAVATILSQAVAFGTAVVYLNRTHKIIRFSFTRSKFDRELFRKSIRIGLPTGLQQTFVSLGMTVLLGIVSGFGTDVIAAYTVAGRIDSIALLPSMIFAQALATFVGQNLGAGSPGRAKKGFYATIIMSGVVSLTVTLAVILLGKPAISLFTSEPAVISIGREYLVIVSSFYFIFSVMFTINGILRGAGDTLIPMFITLFSLWIVRLPLAAILSKSLGATGIWWSIPAGWLFGMIVSFLYYRTGKWKSKVVVEFSEKPERDLVNNSGDSINFGE